MSYGRSTPRFRALCLLAVVALAACDQSDRVLSPSQKVTQPSIDPTEGKTLDQTFVEIERQIPGFAGYYRDADGALTLLSKRESLGQPELQRFKDHLRQARYADDVKAANKPLKYRRVQFSFAELNAWRDQLVASNRLGDVAIVDIDERENRVFLGVTSSAARTEALAQARAMEIPPAALQVDITSPVQFAQGPVVPPPSGIRLNARFTPRAYPGVQIGIVDAFNNPIATCTAGRFMREWIDETIIYTTEFLLTASHCSGEIGRVNHTTAYQPLFGGFNTLLGTEYSDPPFISGPLASCPATSRCRWSDAVIYKIIAPDKGEHWHLLTANSSTTPVSNGGVRMTDCCAPPPAVGDHVKKTGAGTGTSEDVVSRTCISVTIRGAAPGGLNATFLCQNEAFNASTPTSGPADSGAPVWREFSDGRRLWHGLLLGYGTVNGRGRYFYSPSNYIVTDINNRVPLPQAYVTLRFLG